MKFKKGDKVKVKGFYEKDYPFGGIILSYGYYGSNTLRYRVNIIKKMIWSWVSGEYKMLTEEELDE